VSKVSAKLWCYPLTRLHDTHRSYSGAPCQEEFNRDKKLTLSIVGDVRAVLKLDLDTPANQGRFGGVDDGKSQDAMSEILLRGKMSL
jgi:hypothetical protein